MRQNGLYEQKKTLAEDFSFLFSAISDRCTDTWRMCIGGKKKPVRGKGGSERSIGAGASDGGFR